MLNWPTHRTVRIVAAAVMLSVGMAWAQITLEPPPGGGGGMVAPPTPATRSGTAPAATAPASPAQPSAQSILQGLLRENSDDHAPAASAPHRATATGPALDAKGLLREGEKIELRAGHLLKQDDGTVVFAFTPTDQPAYPAMPVVPSRLRAALEDAAGSSDGRKGSDMNFRISAEVTQYRGKNYLYLQPTGVPLPAPVAAPAAATSPAQPVAALMPPAQAAPAAPEVVRVVEGTWIINRTGRLVRDVKTGAELFVLDADGKKMADPPMGVIPCRLLEVMENQTDYGNKSMKFKMSGELTLYRGRNYLLLKAMSAVIDLHQGIAPGLGGG